LVRGLFQRYKFANECLLHEVVGYPGFGCRFKKILLMKTCRHLILAALQNISLHPFHTPPLIFELKLSNVILEQLFLKCIFPQNLEVQPHFEPPDLCRLGLDLLLKNASLLPLGE
jgi:hypothetical protein